MRNFDKLAQQVWSTKDVDQKRELVNQMISSFQYQSQARKFLAIAVSANAYKLDNLAKDILLRDKDAVVRV